VEEAVLQNLNPVGFEEPLGHRFAVNAGGGDGSVVGEYVGDLLVENVILVELKAARHLDDVHAAQCLNYLKATGLCVCLLVNFGGSRVELKRIVNGF
jgi:GxxExxY protein